MPIHSSPDRDQRISVAQVCVRDKVLIYHFCRAIRGSGAFARFIGSADCTFATVERRKNAMIRPSGATSLSTSRSNTRSLATGRRRTPWLTSLRPSSTPATPT